VKIAILGAGSVGCFVGGLLIASGEDVVLFGRQAMADEIAKNGLSLSDLEGMKKRLPSGEVVYSTDPAVLSDSEYILVTVKSTNTGEAGKLIAEHADRSSIVYSLQNGVGNAAILEKELPGFDVVPAMVAFNVIWQDKAHFHRATEGGLTFGKHPASHALAKKIRDAGLATSIASDMEAVLWGKLCLNLNNAINVLSDMPLKQQLQDKSYRKILALCIEEALAVMDEKKIVPAKIAKVRAKHLPSLLSLPDPVFRLVAGSMLKMDDSARSSMWEDFKYGREPEIDFLNGAIVSEGEKLHVQTPVNKAVTDMVKQAFKTGKSPGLSGEELLARVSGQ
jgi:2-dehydropantoate 2-reductase